MMAKILVVEDDPEISVSLVHGLIDAQYDVEHFARGDIVLQTPLKQNFDLIVLDINLPGLDGFELLEHWVSRISTPIIVLTARTRLEDRLQAFDKGAIDFIAKPFFMKELLARIRTRLMVRDKTRRTLSWADVEFDESARTLKRGDSIVGLTPHEFNTLAYLIARPNRAITRRQLAEFALGIEDEKNERTVDSHVARLRKKIGESASPAIQTVWGIGYRFAIDEIS